MKPILTFLLVCATGAASAQLFLKRGSIDSLNQSPATLAPPMANLVQWLKADAITQADDSEVTSWTASVGINATGPSGSTAPRYRTNVKNGLPIIRFDGLDAYLQTADYAAPYSQPLCYFVVFKFNAVNVGQVILDTAHNDAERVFLFRTSGNVWRPYAGSLGTFDGSNESSVAWRILSVEWNGASSKYRFDGGAEAVLGSAPGAQGPDSLRIGMANDSSNPADVDIGEILIYTGTIADKSAHFAYLNAKWAVY